MVVKNLIKWLKVSLIHLNKSKNKENVNSFSFLLYKLVFNKCNLFDIIYKSYLF
jgi:hypothetical protein